MRAHSVFRFLAVLLLALVVSAPAHARVFVSLGFGFPFFPFYGPAYYYPPPAYSYYYPPPYYYPPQQSYYAPQQGYASPDAYAQSAPSDTVSPSSSKNCRTFRGDATIDSSGRPFHGRACLEADGLWHVAP